MRQFDDDHIYIAFAYHSVKALGYRVLVFNIYIEIWYNAEHRNSDNLFQLFKPRLQYFYIAAKLVDDYTFNTFTVLFL